LLSKQSLIEIYYYLFYYQIDGVDEVMLYFWLTCMPASFSLQGDDWANKTSLTIKMATIVTMVDTNNNISQ
jgi:hypothetical protein